MIENENTHDTTSEITTEQKQGMDVRADAGERSATCARQRRRMDSPRTRRADANLQDLRQATASVCHRKIAPKTCAASMCFFLTGATNSPSPQRQPPGHLPAGMHSTHMTVPERRRRNTLLSEPDPKPPRVIMSSCWVFPVRSGEFFHD